MLRIAIKNLNLQRSNHLLCSTSYFTVSQNRVQIQRHNLLNIQRNYLFKSNKDVTNSFKDFVKKNVQKTIYLFKNFQNGMKGLFYDFKQYLRLHWKIRKHGLNALTQNEMQLMCIISNDLTKIIPIMVLAVLPFTNYIIIPLAYYFPHKFLTSHFWTIKDKQKFMLKNYETRSTHYKALMKCMESQIETISDEQLLTKFKSVITRLNNGSHPIIDDIIDCNKLFSESPYSLNCIKSEHARELLKIHGMSIFQFKNRYRLYQRGLLIHHWDIAIKREGGVTKLSENTIQWALLFRGINPVDMSINNMQMWLNEWIKISSQISKENISLLLHCPILLFYNSQKNYVYMYNNEKKK